jgi:hypothetical protein
MPVPEAVHTLKWTSERLLVFSCEPTMAVLVREASFEVLANENDFVRGKPGRWLFMKTMYRIQWLCNLYRIRELRAKKERVRLQISVQGSVAGVG